MHLYNVPFSSPLKDIRSTGADPNTLQPTPSMLVWIRYLVSKTEVDLRKDIRRPEHLSPSDGQERSRDAADLWT